MYVCLYKNACFCIYSFMCLLICLQVMVSAFLTLVAMIIWVRKLPSDSNPYEFDVQTQSPEILGCEGCCTGPRITIFWSHIPGAAVVLYTSTISSQQKMGSYWGRSIMSGPGWFRWWGSHAAVSSSPRHVRDHDTARELPDLQWSPCRKGSRVISLK